MFPLNWKYDLEFTIFFFFGHCQCSFFSWFSETQQKDTLEVEGLNDEVAEIIKEDLWPNPLKYFNNEADEEDSEGEEDDEEGKGDDDEEDDDEDGNEEDDTW